MKSIFRIGFIILWVFVLSFIWPRITGGDAFSVAMWVVGVLLAPFWAGIGIYIGEQIEKRYKKLDSATETPDPQLVGIRGWLILQAIYLVGAGIIHTVTLIALLAQFFDAADAGYGGPFALQILVQLG